MNNPESILSTLTDEAKKKAEAAMCPEELPGKAKEECRELSEEEIQKVSGGVRPLKVDYPILP